MTAKTPSLNYCLRKSQGKHPPTPVQQASEKLSSEGVLVVMPLHAAEPTPAADMDLLSGEDLAELCADAESFNDLQNLEGMLPDGDLRGLFEVAEGLVAASPPRKRGPGRPRKDGTTPPSKKSRRVKSPSETELASAVVLVTPPSSPRPVRKPAPVSVTVPDGPSMQRSLKSYFRVTYRPVGRMSQPIDCRVAKAPPPAHRPCQRKPARFNPTEFAPRSAAYFDKNPDALLCQESSAELEKAARNWPEKLPTTIRLVVSLYKPRLEFSAMHRKPSLVNALAPNMSLWHALAVV